MSNRWDKLAEILQIDGPLTLSSVLCAKLRITPGQFSAMMRSRPSAYVCGTFGKDGDVLTWLRTQL